MVILYALYWFISFLYLNIVIKGICSISLNIFYYIKFLVSGILVDSKKEMINSCKDVSTQEEAIEKLNGWVKFYKYDFLKGALNWIASPIITYLRHKHTEVKHSSDCSDYSTVLRFIIKHSKLKGKYKKVKRIHLLSIKPFVSMSHTIVVGYLKDGSIDVYSPYNYRGNVANIREVIRDIEKHYNGVVYMDFYLS